MVSNPKLTNLADILDILRSKESEENRDGMRRFGINVDNALGIKVTDLRELGRKVERNHEIALKLWATGIHETRILATLVDDPAAVDERQMEHWAAQFDSWDIVDLACNNLFRKTSLAHTKALEWASREEEFTKRAGFALMATLAVHDKEISDNFFLGCLVLIEEQSSDDRNFVKKAVNWALRQIGKRSPELLERAMESAERIHAQGSRSAKWIASDAIRELERIGNQRGWTK